MLLVRLLAVVTVALAQGLPAQDQRPNLVVVVADDCTWSDLGCYGGQAKTPFLDRLCREGMRFDRCFQSASMCSATERRAHERQWKNRPK